MADFQTLRDQLSNARAATETAREQLYAEKQAAQRLDAEIAAFNRTFDPHNTPQAAQQKQLTDARAKSDSRVAQLRTSLASLAAAEAGAVQSFGQLADPQTQIAQLSDAFPFLLMPVRMETRWQKVGLAYQVCVRIYPDDCMIDSFEDMLTDAEIQSAQQYWIDIWRAGGIEAQQRAAWRSLVAASGSGRAAWIVESYLPVNLAAKPKKIDPNGVVLVITATPPLTAVEQAPGMTYWTATYAAHGDLAAVGKALDKLKAAVGAARAVQIADMYRPVNFSEVSAAPGVSVQAAPLVFPDAESLSTKNRNWSQSPVVRVLPDRFVLIGYFGQTVAFTQVGNLIPSPLPVGPDPSAAPADRLQQQAGDLSVPDEIRWMTDFDRAVEIGLGFRVTASVEHLRGFDRLIAVGVRLSADEKASQAAFEELLRHHARTRKGFAFLPQGTPTNNTDDVRSGFSRIDDPDASFDANFKPATPIPGTDAWATRFDSEWFADYLGIEHDAIRTAPGAKLADLCESRALNTALWPATFGYWMDTMMQPLFQPETIDQARWFFANFVSGRGGLPAIRIGYQPYGIVTATAWSRMNWLNSGQYGSVAGLDAPAGARAYLPQLYAVLRKMDADWTQFSQAAPFVGKDGDPHEMLLDILGLHPSSVEYYQRYARSLEHLYNTFNLAGAGKELLTALDGARLTQPGVALLQKLGRPDATAPDILNKFLIAAHNLLKGPVIDTGEFSETDGIRPSTTDGRNYVQWLIDAARASLDTLRTESGFAGNNPPTALLYVLLRHALMLGYWDASLRLQRNAGIPVSRTLLREPAFIHVAQPTQPKVTSESRFSQLYKADARITQNDTLMLADFIPKVIPVNAAASHLKEQLDALEYLKSAPTARLERLFAEHVDCCYNRLDAWELGLTRYQLAAMRYQLNGTNVVPRKGLYLGAFGWLETVWPEAKNLTPVTLDADVNQVFNKNNEPPLMRDASNGGYIHAPSLNQAVTAAVLRSGYLANATADNPSPMAVNLTSDRVRLALSILEGVRAGQSAGALLGYRFERGLHDRHQEAEVDQFIFRLRLAFPLRANQIPGTQTEDEGVSIEAIEARNVIDGVKFSEHVRRTGNVAWPFGVDLLASPPQPTPGQTTAINAETNSLLDLYDALADLAMAEGVHQALQGNYDRVAATLDAYTKGSFPPEPAVVQTPRSGIALTHRVGIHLQPGLASSGTPRSKAEPALNKWLWQILPAQNSVFCRVTYTDPVTKTVFNRDVSLANLAVQPIDLLFLLRIESEQAMAELDDRVFRFVHKKFVPRTDVSMTVSYLTKPAGMISLFELSPMVESLRSLVTTSRPLRPTDVILQTESSIALDDSASIDPARITQARGDADTLRAALAAFAAGPITMNLDASVDQFVDLLATAALLGIPHTGWGALYERKRRIFQQAIDQVQRLATRWDARLAEFDALIASFDHLPQSATAQQRFDLLRSAERLVSTEPANPLPPQPATFRKTVVGKRTPFATRLNLLRTKVLKTTVATLVNLLAQLRPLLPVTQFDLEDISLEQTDRDVALFAADLATRANSLAADVDSRTKPVDALVAEQANASDPAQRVDLLTRAAKALLGDDFPIVPEFGIAAARGNEWSNALTASRNGDLLKFLTDAPNQAPFPVDTWLYGAARVRPKLAQWEKLAILAQALSGRDLPLDPVQLPFRPGDRWLALEFPPDLPLGGDKLLYTAHYSTAFQKTGRQCGLLVDEWNEVIPGDAETTGITFHYDRPNAEAPQAMLLVTPASATGQWQWADLVDAVNETLDMAKKRAVEPVHLDSTPYARFLPAVVAAVTLYPITIAANLAANNGVVTQS